jgi:hypothetical protein
VKGKKYEILEKKSQSIHPNDETSKLPDEENETPKVLTPGKIIYSKEHRTS